MREREGVVARMVERDVAGESDIICSESEYMQRERDYVQREGKIGEIDRKRERTES